MQATTFVPTRNKAVPFFLAAGYRETKVRLWTSRRHPIIQAFPFNGDQLPRGSKDAGNTNFIFFKLTKACFISAGSAQFANPKKAIAFAFYTPVCKEWLCVQGGGGGSSCIIWNNNDGVLGFSCSFLVRKCFHIFNIASEGRLPVPMDTGFKCAMNAKEISRPRWGGRV